MPPFEHHFFTLFYHFYAQTIRPGRLSFLYLTDVSNAQSVLV